MLDKGHLELVDALATDASVVNAARVSFNTQVAGVLSKADAGLINYLLKHHHGTPFEHGMFTFRVKAPIFVFREWHRHRVGHSYNEWSARYSVLMPEFYIPEKEDVVSQEGKPGAYTFTPAQQMVGASFRLALSLHCTESYRLYEEAMMNGIARQQARMFLPVNTYSEMIWTCNPRSLMHFLGLRNSDQAQWEIRQYAIAAEDFFKEAMPITYRAFLDNDRVAP